MKKRTSFGEYACAVAALFTVFSSAETALGQRESEIDPWMVAAPSDLSLAVTQVAPSLAVEQVAPEDSALTSVEEGRTELDQSFPLPQGRLEKQRPRSEERRVGRV